MQANLHKQRFKITSYILYSILYMKMCIITIFKIKFVFNNNIRFQFML